MNYSNILTGEYHSNNRIFLKLIIVLNIIYNT